jgi:hypothetical protein
MIDIQQGMFGPDEICHDPERLLANASSLLERARAADCRRSASTRPAALRRPSAMP